MSHESRVKMAGSCSRSNSGRKPPAASVPGLTVHLTRDEIDRVRKEAGMTTDKPRFRTFQISIPCSGFIIDSTVRPIHPNARVILVEYPNPPYILVILTPVKRGMSIDAFEVTELPGHERIRELNMCYQALDPILGLIHARNELTEKRALIERLLQSPIAPKGSEA